MPIEQEFNNIYLILPIIGVVIGVLLSLIPLHWRLKHDSKEKEKERQISLRRDVYLFAAEKIGQQLSYLTNFYQTGESPPEGYDEAITKIHIVGNNETVTSINEFNDYLTEAYHELIPQKEEINLLQQKGDYLTEHLKGGLGEAQKTIEEFKRIYNAHIKLTFELAGECRQKTQLAEELLTPVIVAIRKELNAPFDEEAYRAMMQISHNKWKHIVEKYINSMKDKCTQALQLIEQVEQETESDNG